MNAVGIVQFQADIAALATKIKQAPAVVVKKLAVEAFSSITELTPVDTGRARASWAMSLNAPSDFLPPDLDPKQRSEWKKKKGTKEPIFATAEVDYTVLARVDGKQPLYIVSNLVYIEPLEEGHSAQAPAGMVRITLAALEIGVERLLQGTIE